MTNLEWVFNNFSDAEIFGTVCILANMSKYRNLCDDKNCFDCEFFKSKEISL